MLTTYQFKGKDLYPFSAGRKDALIAICPGLTEKRIGPFELKAVVFLCAHSHTVCQRAFSAPDQLRVKILEWIDAELPADEDTQSVIKIATDILEGAEKHRVIPKPDEGIPDVQDIDPNS